MKFKEVPFETLKQGDKLIWNRQKYKINELYSRTCIVICREDGTGECLFEYDKMRDYDTSSLYSESLGEADYIGQ